MMIGNSNHGIGLSKSDGDQRQGYVRGFAAKENIGKSVGKKERPHVFILTFSPTSIPCHKRTCLACCSYNADIYLFPCQYYQWPSSNVHLHFFLHYRIFRPCILLVACCIDLLDRASPSHAHIAIARDPGFSSIPTKDSRSSWKCLVMMLQRTDYKLSITQIGFQMLAP